MKEESFHEALKKYIHQYVLLTYKQTEKFPKHELYGLVSQDRRAAVSIMLNYVEGYARGKLGQMNNQYEMSFASLKESIYCKYLAKELEYITEDEYKEAFKLKEKIGAMLYGTIEGIKKRMK